jgi:hypothetical protein
VHDAFDRRECLIADRVGALMRCGEQLSRVGDELPADRIVGMLNERAQGRRDGHGTALHDRGHGVARGQRD